MLGRIVSEHVYKIYSYSTTMSAVLFNSVLIYGFISTQVKHVGPYRWLLLAFAVLNILISILHALVFPFAHLTEFGYIVWGYNLLDQSAMTGFGFMLAWMFLFYQTFIFLTFLFFYRFVHICSPSSLDWTLKNPRRFWITIAVVVDLIYAESIVYASSIGMTPTDKNRRAFAPIMKKVYDIDLFTENLPGYIALAYWIPLENDVREWQWRPIVAMLSACFVVFTALLAIFYCLIRIRRQMSTVHLEVRLGNEQVSSRIEHSTNAAAIDAGTHCTVTNETTNVSILTMSTEFQTVFPTITAYIPIGFALTFPLFLDYPLGGLGTVFLMSIELFPIIDPLIIMIFVKGYRAVLSNCMRLFMSWSAASMSSPHARVAPDPQFAYHLK